MNKVKAVLRDILTGMSICDRLRPSTWYRQSERIRREVFMEEYSLGIIEGEFADIVWQHAPLSTSELVRLCEKQLGWKRTTTYTVLKKFITRGIFDNQNSIVEIRISKEEFFARQSELYIERSFGGSLPGFLTAFTSRKKLSEKEINDLKKIIEKCKD